MIYEVNENIKRSNNEIAIPVQIQANAAVSLAHLAHQCTQAVANEIMESGAVLALVPLLSHPHISLQDYGALALGNIAQASPEARKAIIHAGAVPPSVAMLGSSADSTKAQALYLLTCLSMDPELPDQFYVSNGVEPLADVMIKSSVAALRYY